MVYRAKHRGPSLSMRGFADRAESAPWVEWAGGGGSGSGIGNPPGQPARLGECLGRMEAGGRLSPGSSLAYQPLAGGAQSDTGGVDCPSCILWIYHIDDPM